jgi:hypothetical protein
LSACYSINFIGDPCMPKSAGKAKSNGAHSKGRDEYTAVHVFWLPREARWSYLQVNARKPSLGNLIHKYIIYNPYGWNNDIISKIFLDKHASNKRN